MIDTINNLGGIAAGDRVMIEDNTLAGETRQVFAQVIEVRYILGRQTYVVETEQGRRKVVGASQVSKVEASK